MAEKPKQTTPTPNKQFVEDVVSDIPFLKSVFGFFIREGKAVKSGWLAFAILTGLAFWFGFTIGRDAERSEQNKLVDGLRSAAATDAATIRSEQSQNAVLRKQLQDFRDSIDPSDAAVRKRAKILITQISEFITERKKLEPSRHAEAMKYWTSNEKDAKEKFGQVLAQESDEKQKHYAETMRIFTERFLGRATTVRDQLAELGYKTPQLDYLVTTRLRVTVEIPPAVDELEKLLAKPN